jgi:hypothetical protein
MPISKEKFKEFQGGFNKALGQDDDEEKKKKEKEKMKASELLMKKAKASEILSQY